MAKIVNIHFTIFWNESLLDRAVASVCQGLWRSRRCASLGSPRWSCASRSGSTPWTRSSAAWCDTALASSSVKKDGRGWICRNCSAHANNLRCVWKICRTIVGDLGTMVVLIIGRFLQHSANHAPQNIGWASKYISNAKVPFRFWFGILMCQKLDRVYLGCIRIWSWWVDVHCKTWKNFSTFHYLFDLGENFSIKVSVLEHHHGSQR